jgi:hypothetical protein
MLILAQGEISVATGEKGSTSEGNGGRLAMARNSGGSQKPIAVAKGDFSICASKILGAVNSSLIVSAC